MNRGADRSRQSTQDRLRHREFELQAKVGEGAYGTVYRGNRRGETRKVAIKVMRFSKEGVGIPLDAYREMKVNCAVLARQCVCNCPSHLLQLFVVFFLSVGATADLTSLSVPFSSFSFFFCDSLVAPFVCCCMCIFVFFVLFLFLRVVV